MMPDPHPLDMDEGLRRVAAGLPYPPTPDLTSAFPERFSSRRAASRRLANWAVALCLLILASLLIAPPARAALARILQIGVIRLITGATPHVPLTATPAHTPASAGLSSPQPAPPSSLTDVEGMTTLEAARQNLGYPLRLPTYPEGIGRPDHVYLQSPQEPLVILVWMDPSHPSRPLFSLFIITPGANLLKKLEPQVLAEVQVGDQPAYWARGPYLLEVRRRGLVATHLVSDHALLWAEGLLTYRLETSLPLEEALKIANSLR